MLNNRCDNENKLNELDIEVNNENKSIHSNIDELNELDIEDNDKHKLNKLDIKDHNENKLIHSNINELNELDIENKSVFTNGCNIRDNSILDNNLKESILYESLKNVTMAYENAKINNNKELAGISLNAINILVTIILLKNQSNNDNILVNEINKDNTLVNEINNNNTLVNEIMNETKTKLPDWIKKSRCTINALCTDKESFQYSILLSKHKQIEENWSRKSKLNQFLQNVNFKNINYPLKNEDYEMFERNNESTFLIVFRPNNEIEKLDFHFKSKYIGQRQNRILLILLEGKRYVHVSKPKYLSEYRN